MPKIYLKIYLAVGCAKDVVDAGHDGGDVGDVATIVHGGWNQWQWE